MRIEVTTIDDFCKELREEGSKKNVWQLQVRYRIDRTAEQDEEISFQVGIWLTAVIDYEEDRFILELALATGCDDQEGYSGTAKAEEHQELCDDVGLKLRPGKFELY